MSTDRLAEASLIWEHVITYGLATLNRQIAGPGGLMLVPGQMEAEGWSICAAWMSGRPDESDPWLIWKRPARTPPPPEGWPIAEAPPHAP
jgi:hypothetical protein